MQDDKPGFQKDCGRPGAAAGASSGHPAMSSADLFAGAREIDIECNGRRYRLRITQSTKLILTA